METMKNLKSDFIYQWPPRPTVAITQVQFPFFVRRGFTLTQYKMNGTCSVIGLGPDNRLEVWNRHNEPQRRWMMPTDMHVALRRFLAATASPYWTVVVGELLHQKVSGGPKNTLYLFDVLTYAGQSMVNVKYGDRIGLLHERAIADMHHQNYQQQQSFVDAMEKTHPPHESGIIRVTPTIWVAATLAADPLTAFNAITPGSIREGIVMKNPDSILEPCIKETANAHGAVKCRYATKGYQF